MTDTELLVKQRNGDVTPRPDPTSLTSVALREAIAALREILEARINGDKSVFETRFNAMDQAITLVRKEADSLPSDMSEQVSHLKDVLDERFRTVGQEFIGIGKQFEERDQRTRDSRTADAAALAAALQAAKEAVGEANKAGTLSIDKLERATSEQIKQGTANSLIEFRSVNDKIEALDKRVTRGEGATQGQVVAIQERHVSSAESRDSGRYVMAIIGAIVGIVGLVGGVVLALVK